MEISEAIPSPPTVFESMLFGTVPCTAVYNDTVCGAVLDANPQVTQSIVTLTRRLTVVVNVMSY